MTAPVVRSLLLPLLLLTGLLFGAVAPLQAAGIDSFITAYQKIESYAPPDSLPISSQDLIAARSLFTCLEGGDGVGLCIYDFSNTPLGQQVVQESGLPSSFWSVLDAYVAYRSGDVWGVVYNLGEAAACAVLQVLAGGEDICQFIEELVTIAASLWDTATAVAEFFSDLGEGAWEAVKSAYCDTLGGLFGGCDDGGNSPPEALAYAWVFAPRLAEGLAARMAVDPQAFTTVREQLINQASADPAQFNIPLPDFVRITFPPAAVTTAAEIYTRTVDQNWSAEITSHVLPALGKKRGEYATPAQIGYLASQATAAFKSSGADLIQTIATQCSDDFRLTYGFAHVDRWITYPGTAAAAAKVQALPTSTWCGGSFIAANRQEFAKRFRTFVKTAYCPEFGSTLLCPSVDAYEKCVKVLGTVGEQGQCGINTATAAREAAELVAQALKNRGSKGSYVIVAPAGPVSSSPAELVCQRPPQQHACAEEAQKRFGSYPVTMVNCTVKEPPDYAALRQAVVRAVAILNGEGGGIRPTGRRIPKTQPETREFLIDPVDPLQVYATTAEALEKAQNDKTSYGFKPPSTQPGFAFQLFRQKSLVDGLDTPTISGDRELNMKPPLTKEDMKKKIDPKGVDPIDQLKVNNQRTKNVAPVAMQSGLEKTGAATKTPASSVAKAGTGATAFTAQSVAGSLASAAGQQKQVMSGTLPEGKGQTGLTATAGPSVAPRPSTPSPAGAPTPAPAPPPASTTARGAAAAVTVPARSPSPPLPDLTAVAQVTIAGKTVGWSQPVTLDSREASRTAQGVCSFPFQYAVRNLGPGAAGPVATLLTAAPGPGRWERQWPAIAATAASPPQQEMLTLTPGRQTLTLEIDPLQRVSEANEGNNQFRLQVTVTGTCSANQPSPPARR